MNTPNFAIEIKFNSGSTRQDSEDLSDMLNGSYEGNFIAAPIPNDNPVEGTQGFSEFLDILKIVFTDAGTVLKDAKIVMDAINFVFETRKKAQEYFTGRESVEIKVNKIVRTYYNLDEADRADFLALLKKELYDAEQES